jgi:hypothetical protein
MSRHTIERKLAAPIACLECQWVGKVADINAPGLDGLTCPNCGRRYTIKWIENEAPAALQ